MFNFKKKPASPDGSVSLLGIRMTRAQRINTLNHTFSYGMLSLWAVLVGSTYMQGFLLRSGLTEANISDYSSVLNLASMMGYFLFIAYSGYGKRDQKIYACSALGYLLVPLALILGGVFRLSGSSFFVCLCVGGVISTLCQSLHVVCESVMMRRAMPAKTIGQVLSVALIISSVVGLFISAGAGFLLESIEFPYGYYILFGAGMCCCLPVVLLHLRLKLRPLTDEEVAANRPRGSYFGSIFNSFKTFFTHKESRQIFLPSILRGMKFPCVATATLIITHNVGFSDGLIGAIASVNLGATLLSNLLFAWIVRRVPISAMLLGSTVIGCAGLAVVGFADNALVALIAYFIMTIGSAGYDQACPVAVMVHVPEPLLPSCTSLRLMTFSLMCTLLLPVAGRLIENDLVLPLVAFCFAAWVASGVINCIVFREKGKKGTGAGAEAGSGNSAEV